jgi:hypothetical protein
VFDATFLPPITGQRSLFVGAPSLDSGGLPGPSLPGSKRFRVRLGVPATATRLHLQARPVAPTGDGVAGSQFIFRAAAAGGAITQAGFIEWNGPLMRQPVAGAPMGALFLGQVRAVELPLPAGHGPEVLVDIWAGVDAGCGGPSPAGMALIVDDLRAD